MLTSQARETLANVDTVIVDEVHALAGAKRGAHLAPVLERLDELLKLPRPADRAVGDGETRRWIGSRRFFGGRQPVGHGLAEVPGNM